MSKRPGLPIGRQSQRHLSLQRRVFGRPETGVWVGRKDLRKRMQFAGGGMQIPKEHTGGVHWGMQLRYAADFNIEFTKLNVSFSFSSLLLNVTKLSTSCP